VVLSFARLVIVLVACLHAACGENRAAAPVPGPSPVPLPIPVPVPEPVPAPRPTTATLTGHLRDGETNAPAAGALVAWNAPGGRFQSGRSDGAGSYSFANVPLGVVTISAATTWARGERQVTLTGDSVVDLVLVPLKHTLQGRLTDAVSGAPVAGATLLVIDSSLERRNAGRSTTSASDGIYRLADIWSGTITLQVRRSGYDPVFRDVTVLGETQQDFQMRAAQQTLAGTWSGETTATGFAGGTPVATGIVTVRQTGATIAVDWPGGWALTGTLADPSAIGATTQIAGTLTITRSPSGPRIPPPVPCVGTGRFTGIVNWTNLSIAAPQVTFATVPPGTPSTSPCGSTETVTLRLAR
jgi:hypothetical protein